MEKWKTIEDFEAYEISDLGRVRRLTTVTCTKAGKILKLSVKKGYYVVCLCKDGKKYYKQVHGLVAKAFIPNPLNLPEVNHTGERTDNRPSKLEWISKKDHGRDRQRRNQYGDGVCFHKGHNKWVAHYSPEPGKRVWLGQAFASREEAKAVRDAAVATLE